MINYLPGFEYFEPKTLDEACSLLNTYKERAKVIAGGTDLIVQMKLKSLIPEYLVNLKQISALSEIKEDEFGGLRIGSLNTHRSIYTSPIIKKNYDFLCASSSRVGSVQIQNIGTIGGNVCNASPSADTIPSLMALGAKLSLVSVNGKRVVPIEEFFRGPFKTICEPVEILIEIQIPKLSEFSGGFSLRMGKTTRIDEALVIVSVLVTLDTEYRICTDARICLGSVNPIPMRARMAEDMLKNKKIDDKLIKEVAHTATNEASPRSRAELRRQVTGVLVERALKRVLSEFAHRAKRPRT